MVVPGVSLTSELEAGSSRILPEMAIRDAIALIILLHQSPVWFNCLLLTLYALSGSSRAIAGKVLGKIFKRFNEPKHSFNPEVSGVSDINQLMNDGNAATPRIYDDKSSKITYITLIGYLLNSSAIPLLIHLSISVSIFFLSPVLLSWCTILAKTMIACSLFGINGWRAFGTIVLVMSGSIFFKMSLQHFLSRIFNEKGLFVDILRSLTSIDSKIESIFFRVSYDTNVLNYLSRKYNYSFSVFLKNFFNSFWRFLNYALSIHVLMLELAPNFKYTNFIKSYLASLDQLSKISPEFISNELNADDTEEEEDGNVSNIIPHSTVQSEETLTLSIQGDIAESRLNEIINLAENKTKDNNRILDFSESPASFPDNETHNVLYSNNLSSSLSAVISNLENFCKDPFMSPSSIPKKAKKFSNVRYTQPFWSMVAAFYAMRKRPDIFSGEITVEDATKEENNVDSLVPLDDVNYSRTLFTNDSHPIKCFIEYVGQTSLAFQIVGLTKPTSMILADSDIAVYVNGIEWNTHIYNEEYIVLIGVTPGSTYDIEVFTVPKEPTTDYDYRDALVGKYIICTLLDGRPIGANHSKIESPLETLQKSVTTTTNSVVRERLKLKKLKKENGKALSDISKEIESLANKVRELDKSDERLWKKMANLKTNIQNLEDENFRKKKELESKKEEFEEFEIIYNSEKAEYYSLRDRFTNIDKNYKNEIEILRQEQNNLNNDIAVLDSKNDKLGNKLTKYAADYEKANKELNTLISRVISNRLSEREKSISQRQSFREELRNGLIKVEQMTEEIQEKANKLEEEEIEYNKNNPTTENTNSTSIGIDKNQN